MPAAPAASTGAPFTLLLDDKVYDEAYTAKENLREEVCMLWRY